MTSMSNLSTIPTQERPRLDDRFVKQIEGKDFVLYTGLLDLAHQIGIRSMTVDLLQFPNADNSYIAIAKATVETKEGQVFVDFGDANPSNCNAKVAKHLLRMASTRAKARVLRDMTNIGMTSIEEMDENDFTPPSNMIPFPAQGQSRGTTRGARSDNFQGQSTLRNQSPPVQAQGQDQGSPSSLPPSRPNGSGHGGNGSQSTAQAPHGTGGNGTHQSEPTLSTMQLRAISNLAKRRGISDQELSVMARERFNNDLEQITSKDASSFIRILQTAA